MRVEVLEEKKEWVRVRTHYRYEGWVERGRLFPEGEGTRDFDAAQKRILTKRCADLMREPRVQSSPRVSVPRGALLGVSGRTAENGWSEVILPDGSRAWTRTNDLAPHVTSAQGKDEAALRREIVQAALPYLGAPYRWGGKSPLGIDCSGLCSMAYMLCGVLIYRDAKIVPGFPCTASPLTGCRWATCSSSRPRGDVHSQRPVHPLHLPRGGRGRGAGLPDAGHPRYRGDLRETMTDCGSIF